MLLVFVLLPSILFAGAYGAGLASGTRAERYSQPPGSWNLNLTVSHPSYLVSGQQVAVTIRVGVSAPDKNYSVGVNDVVLELRQPTVINTTSNIVTSWSVLGSTQVVVNQNFTGPSTVTKVVTLMATMPPTSGALDLFAPTSEVGFNGVVDLTIYQKSGGAVSASPQSVSLVDSATYYRNELSTIASTSSWVTYQLLAAVAGLVFFVRNKPPFFGAPTDSYSLGLKSYRVERSLSRLDEMRKSGIIGQQRYDELKQGFTKELDRLKGASSRS
jgi:hypothetical protein